MWHYQKWVGAVIVVSNEIRILDELFTSKLLGYELINVYEITFLYYFLRDNK